MKKLQLLFFAFLIGFTAAIAPVSASIEPVHAGSIVHGSGGALLDVPYGVFVVGNYAYVTSRLNQALEIVDISDPAAPVHKGNILDGDGGALLDDAYDVFVAGNYAYVGSAGSNALEIVDVTDSAPPTITVTSPNGGEIWKQGTIHTIRWTYTGDPGANVKIQLLKAGVVKKVISTSAPIGTGGSGSFTWKVPFNQVLGKDYKIRIISTTDTTKRDASDKVFTISAGAPITVKVPNGGEIWKRGTIQTIRWNYTGNPGAKVKIELLKGTKVNRVISAAAPIGTVGGGLYKWKIPANQVTGTDYRIRITSTTQPTKKDVSNKVFRIKA